MNYLRFIKKKSTRWNAMTRKTHKNKKTGKACGEILSFPQSLKVLLVLYNTLLLQHLVKVP